MIQIKRAYEKAGDTDGFRILVDRLWPRGISKEHAALDIWLKEVAPSPELRIWFNHEPTKFTEFSERYRAELMKNTVVPELIKHAKNHKTLTLVYGAKDPVINHAAVLLDFLKEKIK